MTNLTFCVKIAVERGLQMGTRRPILEVVREISRRLKLRGYSIRRVEADLKKIGITNINRGKIIRLFYVSEKNNQDFLNNADDTIEAVLTLLDLTSQDIYQTLLEQCTDYNTEMIDFIQTPEAVPYLKQAYNQYKADKLESEIKQLQEQIKKLRE